MIAPDTPARRAVFLDKDGPLVRDAQDSVDTTALSFPPGTLDALRQLTDHGFLLVIASNQPGIGRGQFARAAWVRVEAAIVALLAEAGVPVEAFYICPHPPAPDPRRPRCLCRKPAPGLLLQAARARRIDLARSWIVGDVLDDIEAGRRAGCQTVLLDDGRETGWHLSPLRTPHHVCADLAEATQTILSHDRPDPVAPLAANQAAAAGPALHAAP